MQGASPGTPSGIVGQNNRSRLMDYPSSREAATFNGYVNISFGADVYMGALLDERFLELRKIIESRACIAHECQWILYNCVRQCISIPGEFWECGVFLGGSARLIRELTMGRQLRLFDTFSQMPKGNDEIDFHSTGDFVSTGLEDVVNFVGPADYHVGLIPETFSGLAGSMISFAHIDLDLHDSTLEALKFIYPRVMRGGMILIDDYGRPTTMGVRKAVDDFFSEKPEFPIFNITASNALVVKL